MLRNIFLKYYKVKKFAAWDQQFMTFHLKKLLVIQKGQRLTLSKCFSIAFVIASSSYNM